MSKVALITGGGSGIGAATARRLTRAGWQVAICGRRRESLDKVAADTGALVVTADVSRPDDVARTVDTTVAEFGRLDGVVLNAGVIRPGTVLDLTAQEYEETVRTNLTGVFFMAQQAIPHLLAGKGSVVTVSSVAGLRASAGMCAYSASKAAASMLTQSLAVDFGPRGLRANVVCPGWTSTEMADAEMAEYATAIGTDVDTAYRRATAFVPARRPASADEVSRAICWLLSDDAVYVNGTVLPVDGGLCAVDPGTVPFDGRVSLEGIG